MRSPRGYHRRARIPRDSCVMREHLHQTSQYLTLAWDLGYSHCHYILCESLMCRSDGAVARIEEHEEEKKLCRDGGRLKEAAYQISPPNALGTKSPPRVSFAGQSLHLATFLFQHQPYHLASPLFHSCISLSYRRGSNLQAKSSLIMSLFLALKLPGPRSGRASLPTV